MGNQSLSEDEAEALFQVYLHYYEEKWALFDDVLPCFSELSRYKLGIISNGNGEQQRRKLHQLNIADKFVAVIISEDIGVWKPKSEIFLEACRQASVLPSDCFYVGDNLVVDAQASQAAGLSGIWLNRNYLPASEVGVSVISGLAELVAAV